MYSEFIIKALKLTLKSKNINYREIARELRVSEPTVKRWFSQNSLSIERFSEIISKYGIKISELARILDEKQDVPHEYTEEQELYLSSRLDCLAYFDSLIRYGSPVKVSKALNISVQKGQKFLLALDKIELIRLEKNWRVRFQVGRNVVWRKNGPLRQRLLEVAKTEFLNSNFSESSDLFKFSLLDLSKGGSLKAEVLLKDCLKQIKREAELDKVTGKAAERRGLMIAFREWNLAALAEIKN